MSAARRVGFAAARGASLGGVLSAGLGPVVLPGWKLVLVVALGIACGFCWGVGAEAARAIRERTKP